MARSRNVVLVEIALTVALCAALYGAFHLWMPWNFAGGEIALTMVPIMVLALRRGPVAGVAAGALWGALQLLFEPQFVLHPAQALLDYPVAFGLVGLSGLGAGAYARALADGGALRASVVGLPWLALGALARYVAHVLSGIVFFAANAPAGQPVFVYSLAYNAAYVLPSAALCVLATLTVLPVLERAVPPQGSPSGLTR